MQVYIDDIIFVVTNLSLCEEFSKCMHSEYEMSIMAELNLFLGFQKVINGRNFHQPIKVN